MDHDTREFLLAEYASLRAEVLDAVREVPRNERFAVAISGAFWSWFVVKVPEAQGLYVIAWLPLAFTVLLFLRARSLDGKFDAYHSYLVKIEESFRLNGLGWEHHIGYTAKARVEAKGKSKATSWFPESETQFWCFMIAGNLFLFGLALFQWMFQIVLN